MFKKSLLLFVLFITMVVAQSTKDKIQNHLNSAYEADYLNGTVAVLKNGTLFYEGSFGYSDPQSQQGFTVSTPFRMASITKQFSGFLIMLLIEDGKVTLDDDLRKFFPELSYKNIKVKHLLEHSSGLPSMIDLAEKFWQPEIKSPAEKRIIQNEDLLQLFADHKPPLNFEPGTKLQYSNTGYFFLAVIAERAASKNYEQLINEMIFKPLEMKNSFVNTPANVKKYKSIPVGYKPLINGEIKYREKKFFDDLVGSYGTYSCIEDMLKYEKALSEGKLISESKLDSYLKNITFENGRYLFNYGWVINKSATGKLKYWCDGTYAGFHSYFSRLPKDGYSVVILTNNSSPKVIHIGEMVEQILLGEDVELIKPSAGKIFASMIYNPELKIENERVQEIYQNEKLNYDFSEAELNRLGYRFLWNEEFEKAIKVFEINTMLYPGSANSFDSLAEALHSAGNKKEAIVNYKKALKLDPNLKSAEDALKKLGE